MASKTVEPIDDTRSVSASSSNPQKLYLKPSDLARKLRDVERQIAEELERTEQYQASLRRLRVHISERDQELRDVQNKLDCLRGVERQHGGVHDEGDELELSEASAQTHGRQRQRQQAAADTVISRAVKDGITDQFDYFMRTPLTNAEDAYDRIHEKKH